MNNEAKVGILAIVAIIILILGYNFLKGKNLLNPQNSYTAIYDKVDGLLTANPVTVNGLQVGIVEDIWLQENGKIGVSFLIDDDIKIPKGSEAQIMADGLLGDMKVAIQYPENMIPNSFYASGDAMPGVTAKGLGDMADMAMEQLDPIRIKAEDILKKLDSVIVEAKTVINSQEVDKIFTDVKKTINTTKSTIQQTNKLLKNTNTMVEEQAPKVSKLLDNANHLAGDLTQDIKKIGPLMDDFKSVTSDAKEMAGQAKIITKKASGLTDKMDNIISTDVKAITGDMKGLSGDMKVLSGDIKEITGNAKILTKDAQELTQRLSKIELEKLASNADSTLTKAGSAIDQATTTLSQVTQITEKINAGEGSIGQLMTDTALYQTVSDMVPTLDSTLNSASQLLDGINESPKSYFSLISIGDGKGKERRMKRRAERKKRRLEKRMNK